MYAASSPEDGEILSDRTIRRKAAAQAAKIMSGSRQEPYVDTNDEEKDIPNFMEHEHEHVSDEPYLDQPPLENSFIVDVNCHSTDASVHLSEDDEVSFSESESNDTDEEGSDADFKEQLQDWVLRSGTPLVHVNSLLALLRPHFPTLSKDGRTLLQTQCSCTIENVAWGQYHH